LTENEIALKETKTRFLTGKNVVLSENLGFLKENIGFFERKIETFDGQIVVLNANFLVSDF